VPHPAGAGLGPHDGGAAGPDLRAEQRFPGHREHPVDFEAVDADAAGAEQLTGAGEEQLQEPGRREHRNVVHPVLAEPRGRVRRDRRLPQVPVLRRHLDARAEQRVPGGPARRRVRPVFPGRWGQVEHGRLRVAPVEHRRVAGGVELGERVCVSAFFPLATAEGGQRPHVDAGRAGRLLDGGERDRVR
jgi:hypothetical protein